MKILKEETITKEALPISFITDMVSKGWDEVGYLKEATAAIRETYKDTSKVEDLMQDLMDAYLVFIGQLELYLNNEEDIDTNISKVKEEQKTEETPIEKVAEVAENNAEEPVEDQSDIAELPEATLEVEPLQIPAEKVPVTAVDEDDFDFFMDFDEPDLSQPPVSDSELYNDEGTLKTRILNS